MRDDEIATKRLSDWKPETDIKLQKAFGKFVEEAGELLEATFAWGILQTESGERSFEDELADCVAFIILIEAASDSLIDINQPGKQAPFLVSDMSPRDVKLNASAQLSVCIGRTLEIIGRCQIQGLVGRDPDTGDANAFVLSERLADLNQLIIDTIRRFKLDARRISDRTNAKVRSKFPWVMGIATDLLPST